jgi:PrcB C-terminal
MNKNRLVTLTTIMTVVSCAAQPFAVIRSTVSSGIAGAGVPTLLVAENKAAFATLFERMMAAQLPRPVIPNVDLAKNIALYISLGKKPTTGYSLNVNSVSCRGSNMQVLVGATFPDPKDVAGQIITNPALLLAILRCPDMKAIEVSGAAIRLRHDLASTNSQSGGIQ